MGQHEVALAIHHKILSSNNIAPARASSLLEMGEIYLELGRLDDALASFRQCGLVGITQGRLYSRLARIYARKGDHQAALNYYEAAQKKGFALEAEDERTLAKLRAPSSERKPPLVASEVFFENVAAAAGVRFRHYAGYPILHLPQSVAPGVAVVDFDGDGFEDLFFVNSADFYQKAVPPLDEQSSRLYRNDGDGTFVDVTREAGLWDTRFGCAAIFPDIDNDGYPDIVLTGLGFAELLRNNGDGTFTSQPGALELVYDPGNLTCGATAGDYDIDGLLDVYVPSYTIADLKNIPPRPLIYTSEDEPTPMPITMRPLEYKAAPNHLLGNQGDFTLKDRTATAGVANLSSGHERSLQSAFADIDNDGYPDILVANDVGDMAYFRNQRDGTFKDLAKRTWINDARGNMGLAVADYNWDGALDVAVTHWATDSTGFFRNEMPKPLFTDIIVDVGLQKTDREEVGWGDALIDYDNDGFLDFYWVNGHTQARKYDPATCYTTDKNIPIPQHPRLFKGDGRRFVEVTQATGFGREAWVSRGSAYFDLDHDGALDVAIANNYGAAALLKNQGVHGHWITFELVGTRSNRQSVGARVRLTLEGTTRLHEVHLGSSYFAQDTLTVHYGLGKAERVPKVEIWWPSGKRQILSDVPADGWLRVVEPAA
jgi:hypothetical protein